MSALTSGAAVAAEGAVELSEGQAAAAEPLARALYEMTGPLAAGAWAVTLAAAGRALTAARQCPPNG